MELTDFHSKKKCQFLCLQLVLDVIFLSVVLYLLINQHFHALCKISLRFPRRQYLTCHEKFEVSKLIII